MNDRLRQVRKYFKLNQEEFGRRLGVTAAGISRLESGERNITRQMILAVCREFNISEEWLEYGIEPMFLEQKTFSFDTFLKDRTVSELELEILKAYFDLDSDIRTLLIQHFKNKLTNFKEKKSYYDKAPKTPEELETLFPPEDIKKRIG